MPPIAWASERVAVNAAGTIGLSTGPVFDSNGKQTGSFSTIWIKQSDGTWKALFDGPGADSACVPGLWPPQEEGFIETTDGAKLHYRKVGYGPITVIMPLGFVTFDDFQTLGNVATLISYDPRDRGRSSAMTDTSKMTIRDDVADLEAVRAHFKVDKFVPVGYSYLGLMVALYAMEHPEHVSRLVQLSPVPMKAGTQYPKELTNGYDDMAVPDADVKKWREMQAAGMAEKTPREFCEQQDKVFQYLLVGPAEHAPRVQSHCDLANEWPSHLDKHVKASFDSIQKITITDDDLKKISMPVLTIHGTKDRNAPYGSGREWATKLPNARLVTVEGAAHQSWTDDPVTVFASIREFLRGSWPLAAEKISQIEPPKPALSEKEQYLEELRQSIKGRENEPAEKVFKNVRVLPTTVPGVTAERLLRIMDLAYSRSLGVPCSHCHTPRQWDDDSKPPKQIARAMSHLVTTINHEILPSINELKDRNPVVNCATCHRGQIKPATAIP